jgi:hypothetical protein
MKSALTFSIATLFVLPAMSCAQERRSPDHDSAQGERSDDRSVAGNHKSPDAGKAFDSENGPRRLESVTWNSVKHELTWVISKGEKKQGASYKALGSTNYEINMDDATMSFSGESRRFSKEEAANVHVLMDLIAKYAVDSTVWWDDGQGEPVNGDGKGTKEPEKPQRRKHDQDDDNVAILHVSTGGAVNSDRGTQSGSVTPAELGKEIRDLERKLAALKEIQKMLGGRLQLTSYSN